MPELLLLTLDRLLQNHWHNKRFGNAVDGFIFWTVNLRQGFAAFLFKIERMVTRTRGNARLVDNFAFRAINCLKWSNLRPLRCIPLLLIQVCLRVNMADVFSVLVDLLVGHCFELHVLCDNLTLLPL